MGNGVRGRGAVLVHRVESLPLVVILLGCLRDGARRKKEVLVIGELHLLGRVVLIVARRHLAHLGRVAAHDGLLSGLNRLNVLVGNAHLEERRLLDGRVPLAGNLGLILEALRLLEARRLCDQKPVFHRQQAPFARLLAVERAGQSAWTLRGQRGKPTGGGEPLGGRLGGKLNGHVRPAAAAAINYYY